MAMKIPRLGHDPARLAWAWASSSLLLLQQMHENNFTAHDVFMSIQQFTTVMGNLTIEYQGISDPRPVCVHNIIRIGFDVVTL